MFEKIIKIKDSEEFLGSCIVRLMSDVKNSYQFELDRIAVKEVYENIILKFGDYPNSEAYAQLFEGFGYTVEFIEPELTIEI